MLLLDRCVKCKVFQDGIDGPKTATNQSVFLVCREMSRRDVHNIANHVGVTVAACPGVSQLAGAASYFQTLFSCPRFSL